jgi:hypothetical protein
MASTHRHSRYVAGCATCERDMLFFRLTDLRKVTPAQRDEAWELWRADDMAGLQALATRTGVHDKSQFHRDCVGHAQTGEHGLICDGCWTLAEHLWGPDRLTSTLAGASVRLAGTGTGNAQ